MKGHHSYYARATAYLCHNHINHATLLTQRHTTTLMLHIVADQEIAHVNHYFSEIGHLTLLPAAKLNNHALKYADVLLVRSVTSVNENLLADTNIHWVGTMTSGMDHINPGDMKRLGIPYANAPGCNASAVAEYVLGCIASCMQQNIPRKKILCAGIIGHGHAGQHVERMYKALGWQVLCYDPPKALRDPSFKSATLQDLMACDVISVHASLHDDPPFPSRHLIDKNLLQLLKSGCIFINASRGDVCREQDLYEHGQHLTLCLDVWQHEPNINPTTIAVSTIASPHIAGHSDLAKLNATQHIYRKLCQTMALHHNPPTNPLAQQRTTSINADDADWSAWVLQAHDPEIESHAMHTMAQQNQGNISEQFIRLRKQHQRHGFASHTLKSNKPQSIALAHALGFAAHYLP